MISDKKNIVIINQDSGYLMIDIANAFSNSGYNVTLIAGRIVERDTKLNSAILLRKITAYNRLSILKRLYSWIYGFVGVVYVLKKYHKNDELLIVSNPPIALFIPFFCKNKFNLLIFDVYIDTLQKFVPLKRWSPLVLLWKKLHKFVLFNANSIFVLTEGMKNTIKTYAADKEINILALWSDNSTQKLVDKNDNPIIKQYNLEDSFVVFYSGNIGLTSGVESIIELALLLKNDPQFKFLIVGDGLQKDKIKTQIIEYNLTNCILLPRQSYELMTYTFACADISVVSLASHSSNNSIPSKIFTYLSAGTPILCIANQLADISKFVELWKVGKVFSAESMSDAALFLKNLRTNTLMISEFKRNVLIAAQNSTSENANVLVKYLSSN